MDKTLTILSIWNTKLNKLVWIKINIKISVGFLDSISSIADFFSVELWNQINIDLFEKTSTLKFQRKQSMVLKLFAFLEQFKIDKFFP